MNITQLILGILVTILLFAVGNLYDKVSKLEKKNKLDELNNLRV